MTNSNANSNIGAAELFHMLESNKLKDVEEIKKVFHDHFLTTKDSWLVSGLFDYYLSTDSLRAVEVLAGVREPHDKHLFDKLTETLSAKPSNNGQKVRTLTLLGHVARRQPTWLYRLANHSLFKQLLHLLKVEEDIVLLMSGLLLLITLLPMLPTALTPHLNEIFEVFSRLASFYYNRLTISNANAAVYSTTSTGCDVDLNLLHLQVGLHNLFHRLYAMYPCNFVSFLKHQYLRDQSMIFKKVISPMLDSVRMHPLLVTMSKETEISSSRWKKMEHHDVVAECSRFSLFERSSREEIMSLANMRFTPISVFSEYSCPYTPVSNSEFPMPLEQQNLDKVTSHESFWSPSMLVGAHSPPATTSLQATPLSHVDPKSAPPTPGGSAAAVAAAAAAAAMSPGGAGLAARSRTSPPEAAVEATPETTPIKDPRSGGHRQVPLGSAAVRALSSLGANGSSSRPSTPSAPTVSTLQQQQAAAAAVARLDLEAASSILDRKLNRLVAERQNASVGARQDEPEGWAAASRRSTPGPPGELSNGRPDSWQQQPEDQEVSDIVSASSERLSELARKVKLKVLLQNETPQPRPRRRAASWPGPGSSSLPRQRSDVQPAEVAPAGTFRPLGRTEDSATQTQATLPYECLLHELTATPNGFEAPAASRALSPSAMLERYIELCAGLTTEPKPGSRPEELANGETNGQQQPPSNEETATANDSNQQLQMIQLLRMQLQFERQRRQVHAERNRRLLGKLRDSRALEELNSSMVARLKLAESDIEALRAELNHSRQEARSAEQKLLEGVQHWQTKCREEERRGAGLRERISRLEDELAAERARLGEHERQRRAAEATLFEAAHQLKEALRAANQSEELKRLLDTVQRRFLLLGEAQARSYERQAVPARAPRHELALAQRSWAEELAAARRQMEAQTLQLEAARARLGELELRDARLEAQLLEQQRLLREAQERHAAELEAVESKYRAQLEVNLMLEGRVLELHGRLEQATCPGQSFGSVPSHAHGAASISPKERSPPLSASLASSSEGSLAFIHSAVNDHCCDPAAEIANLHSIVDDNQR